jgi:hypothetical protein
MSAFGVKRTSRLIEAISAFEPKRTWLSASRLLADLGGQLNFFGMITRPEACLLQRTGQNTLRCALVSARYAAALPAA